MASVNEAGTRSGSGSRSFPYGDTTFTKVFVGGLAWETRSETMRRYFEQFGDIIEAVVITDKNTARSKGYGFVSSFFTLITIGCIFIVSCGICVVFDQY